MNRLLLIPVIMMGYGCSNAMDERVPQQKHEDQCIQSCINYYNDFNNLEGFSYYPDAFNAREDKSIGKAQYCKTARQSLDICYEQDSYLYAQCKSTAKWLASFFTNDPVLLDKFSSCKKQCESDLETFCATQDEDVDDGVTDEVEGQFNVDVPIILEGPATIEEQIEDLNPEDQYAVIFAPFAKRYMSGEEMQELSANERKGIKKIIAMDRITLVDGSHVYVNPNDTYRVVIKNLPGKEPPQEVQLQSGEQIANSIDNYISITRTQ